jgi:hypothetical protein
LDAEDGEASLIRDFHELCSLELLSTGKSMTGLGRFELNRKKNGFERQRK